MQDTPHTSDNATTNTIEEAVNIFPNPTTGAANIVVEVPETAFK